MISLRFWVGPLLLLAAARLAAHPMPSSLVFLSIHEQSIGFEVNVPLPDWEAAFGPLTLSGNTVVLSDSLQRYVAQHLRLESGGHWQTQLEHGYTMVVRDSLSGEYGELVLTGSLLPPGAAALRRFTLHYDLVMHQVVTHQALVYIRQDWANGVIEEPGQVATILVDIPTGNIFPVEVVPGEGSRWKGCRAMMMLGMRHIAEGTDHLLFLLVLLLPAPLLAEGKRWGKAAGISSSLRALVRIVTAFTLGHSLTLLLGSLHWNPFPVQWVEVCVAGSVLVSAIHALYPIFCRREIYVAAGFGLVHGLAFSETLTQLRLSPLELGLSLAGFNLGIEAMQLIIMAVVLPGLLIISRRPNAYQWVRIGGACIGMVAAMGWLAERMSDSSDAISSLLAFAGR